MALLNDIGILEAMRKKEVSISPLSPDRIQPASVDLSIGDTYAKHGDASIDLSKLSVKELKALENQKSLPNEGITLAPGESVICYTRETITFSRQICGTICNRSSVVRWGIDAAKANFINPGFSGCMPLVIHNFGRSFVTLKPGMIVCQLRLDRLEARTIHTYEDRHDPSVFGNVAEAAGFSKGKLTKRADDPLSKFLHEKISEVTAGK